MIMIKRVNLEIKSMGKHNGAGIKADLYGMCGINLLTLLPE